MGVATGTYRIRRQKDETLPKLGTCKLCHSDDVELQDSHVLPAGLYRLLRGSVEDRNPNPWIIQGKTQVQTSRQEKAYLLCRDCEQRLNRCGEKWVLGNALRPDGTFPLGSLLVMSPAISDPNRSAPKLYFAASIPGINIPAIGYFAASIFWRASVHDWKVSDHQVRLGPYEEAFRSYLMGEAAFPQGAVLSVRVRSDTPAGGVCQFPSRMRHVDGVRAHTFTMPGLTFSLFTGKVMPGYISRACFVRGVGNPLAISYRMEDTLVKQLARALEFAEK